MKKNLNFALAIIIFMIASTISMAQGFDPNPGFRQFNFGVGTSGYGIPVFAGLDFAIGDKITLGPQVGYRGRNNDSYFSAAVRSDYHYGGHITGLPRELDLYGGVSLVYVLSVYDYLVYNTGTQTYREENVTESDIAVRLQAGARWYFNQKWGVMAELSGSTTTNASGIRVGGSVRF